MGVSIISIMLFHQQWISIPPFNAFHIWGHYGVDIFLFVSGFGLGFSLQKHSLVEFYKRRFKRLAPLCFFCGICKIIIFLIWKDQLHDLKDISYLTLFGLDLWFIQTIVVFYLLAPLIYILIRRRTYSFLAILYLLCLASTISFPEVQNNITGSLNRLPAFTLGMAFITKKWSIDKRQLLCGLIFLTIAMTATALTSKHIINWGNNLWMYPILSIALSSITFAICNLKKYIWNKICTIVESIGGHTLEIYLWHEFIFGCIWLTLNGSANNYILLLLAFSASIFIAYCSYYFISFFTKSS